MHASAVDVREIGVGFIEDHRKIRPRKNDCIDSFAFAELLRQFGQDLKGFLAVLCIPGQFEISVVNVVDFVPMRLNELQLWQLSEQIGVDRETCSEYGNTANATSVNLVVNCIQQIHQW